MAGYKNSRITSINGEAKNTYAKVWHGSPDGIKSIFSESSTFRDSIKYNPVTEYIKKMIISQMDISSMLAYHKYYYSHGKNEGFEAESKKIKKQILEESTINFDEETLEALFGNTYGIKTEEGYNILKEILYPQTVGKILNIYSEEKFKYDYEHEERKLKKLFMSFKYKKLFREDVVEDKKDIQTRDILRDFIYKNPGVSPDIILYSRKEGGSLNKGMKEYEQLKRAKRVGMTVLQSLQQQHCVEPINVIKACDRCVMIMRGDFQERNGEWYKYAYREGDKIKCWDIGKTNYSENEFCSHKEIKNRLEDLQGRYEELFMGAETNEDYIKGVSRIYADFIDIHPYEDGNKIASTCLLNIMLLSKGIVPPPISPINDEKLGEVFQKKGEEKYTAIEELITNGCKNIEELWDGDKKTQDRGTKIVENEKPQR